MRWATLAVGGLIGMSIALLGLWGSGGAAPVGRAEESGAIVGWVYYGTPAYLAGAATAAPGAVPADQPAERGDVDEAGELPPSPPPTEEPQGATGNAPSVAPCYPCPPYPGWPVPVQGALVAVQGTTLSATTDEDGWFMIEGVPVGAYYTVGATIPRSALLVLPDGETTSAAPFGRGAYALRVNALVKSATKPLNVGALFVYRTSAPPVLGPIPAQTGPGGAPDEGTPAP